MTQSTLQIPELIRALRKRLNLSQEKFAARLGVSFQTINRWEIRTNHPVTDGD